MLFNSYEFAFGFLPLTLLIFYVLGRLSRTWALGWIIVASLGFYAWWRPLNVAIIAPSIAINFIVARLLCRWRKEERSRTAMRVLLTAGIIFNVAFLGYFKYTDFLIGATNDLFGTQFALMHIVLPLAISFITFQKIAFLIDVHGGRVESFSLRDYCLFVLFFPQLIAGPIVHYREVMPQFHAASCRFNATDASVGLTLFVFGLFKKVILADGLSPWVSMLYGKAASGAHMSLVPAWLAAVGFTLQIYFDFSGYTDMALGLGRFFGIRLPANFDSPLKAPNIMEFWLRWHMTLTRFLTAYIYNPLTLALTRRRMAAGLPVLSARKTGVGTFTALLAFPTLLTMLVSGIWHGAGYLFMLWGLLHGVYLTINHAWRRIRTTSHDAASGTGRLWRPLSVALTFVSVAASMVLFRSTNWRSAREILSGMIGVHGIGLPARIMEGLGPLSALLRAGGVRIDSAWSATDLVQMALWCGGLLGIALFCPNSLQLMNSYDPALARRITAPAKFVGIARLAWNPSLPWAVAASLLAVIAVVRLAGPSEFLYWQF